MTLMNRPKLQVLTFGQLDLVLEGGKAAEALLAQPKRAAVLVHLVLTSRSGMRTRDRLQAMFWPEAESSRAQHSLRQTLHVLRQHLPTDVISGRGGHAVGVTAELVRCDALEFRDLVRAERLEEALGLYTGDLLPGLFLGEGAEFHEWLEGEREQLRQMAVSTALRLARRQSSEGRGADAVGTLHRALRHAPLNEVVLRDVLELLLMMGDRATASAVYRDFVQRLEVELGLDPSPETTALAAAVEQPLVPSSPVVPGPVTPGVEPAPAGAGGAGGPISPALPSSPVALDVFHLYQKGRMLVEQRTPRAVRQAIRSFEQAVRLEPRFAEAHDGLAEAWMVLPVYVRMPADEARARVLHHAEQALRLDPALASAHAHQAWARLVFDWDWAAAEAGFARSLELDPHAVEPRLTYAVYLLSSMGRFAEAVAALETGRALHPTAPHLTAYLGMVRYFARDYERALQECSAILDVTPDFPLANWVCTWTEGALGNGEAALSAARRAVQATQRSPLMLAHQGYAAAVAGDEEQARGILHELESPAGDPIPDFFTAAIHAALCESDIALDQLYRAYRQRSPHMVLVPVIPLFDPLREHRRFGELAERMGVVGVT